MKVPIEITYRGIPKSQSLEELIHERTEGLERVCDYLNSCRVSVEKQSDKHPYHVRVDLTVPPGKELVVSRDPGESEQYDVRAVVHSAFEAARQQLKELVERQRGKVKDHPQQAFSGVVVRLFSDQGFGFIKAVDGREFYFHSNSVLSNDFPRLEVGTGVAFTEEEGTRGPQASTVRIVDKPGTCVSKSEESLPEAPLG